MNNKIKVLIAVGGTGGHVFPGCNLGKFLIDKNYDVNLITDKRGKRYLKKFENLKTTILPSSPLSNKNFFTLFFSLALVFFSTLRSLIFLIFNKPNIIFGMGGYASFPICIAARILNIKLIIYENNLIIGKANKHLLPFTKKILVSHKELEGIPKKYNNKIIEIGNIIDDKIINFSKLNVNNIYSDRLNILILGGSQAAKSFAEILPNIFKKCLSQGIKLKVYQHCLPNQNELINSLYKNIKLDFEIFNFNNDLTEYFSKINLAITRAGSSILAELTNANIPFISVPLPSSADNHQLKNAIYYQKKKFGYLLEEKDLKNKLFYLIEDIHRNRSLLDKIKLNQRQYSDKNVYNNIDRAIKGIIDEKS